jgi:SAM-dependent methyltransferase
MKWSGLFDLFARPKRSVSPLPLEPNEPIRLAFLIMTPEVWPTLSPIYERACNDSRFDCCVRVVTATLSGVAEKSAQRAIEMLNSAGVAHEIFDPKNLSSFRPHVLFYPLPYPHYYPESCRPDALAQIGVRLAYVPYGLEVGGGAFNARYQYDTEVSRKAWRIFARSDAQRESFGRHCATGNAHVIVTGHPRVELGLATLGPAPNEILIKAAGRRVVLWTPHFSVLGQRNWSTFIEYQEVIIAEFDARPDLFLLVRPHPFLRSRLAGHPEWGTSRTNKWFADVVSRGNAWLDTSVDYHAAFDASSALLSDAGSFLVEYLSTGKPICHLSGPDDIGLSEEVRLLACHYRGRSRKEITHFLDNTLSGDDPLLEVRSTAALTYFGATESQPSERILNAITEGLAMPNQIAGQTLALSDRHRAAHRYWTRAKTTFLAPPEYYDRQERLLAELLGQYARGRFAADVGCGNGRFTEVLARYFERVEAIDPNQHLIEEATASAIRNKIGNIIYQVDYLEETNVLSTYDMVSCMGVLSGIIDEDAFRRAIWKLRAALLPGSHLLLKESLSLAATESIDWNGYVAVYRHMPAYLRTIEATGLTLIDERVVAQDEEKARTNRMFIFGLE